MATRSLGPNGELMLVFDDKNAYEYVEQNRSDCQDALKAAAADRIGKRGCDSGEVKRHGACQ